MKKIAIYVGSTYKNNKDIKHVVLDMEKPKTPEPEDPKN